MKLCYLVHDFLPEHVGGTEVHTGELARELARRGHEVLIVCTERDLSRTDGDILERTWNGLRVLEVAHAREYACAEHTWEEAGARVVLARILERERPDLLHVQHFAQWGSAVLEEARVQAIPSVVTLHDYHLLCANACLLRTDGSLCSGDCAACLAGMPRPREGADARALEAAAEARRSWHARHLRLASRVIAPSKFLARMMLERRMCSAQQLVQLASGVAGPWREPRLSNREVPLRLAFVGGIYPSKGVHVLAQAFARLPRGSATLDVHGVLEWFPSYVAHLRALCGEREDVRWRGRFEPEELDARLDDADVLVVPSLWYENSPLTIQAAFRRGVCVVASDLGGMAELVQPGHGGALFRHGDATSLAQLLGDLALDRERVLELARMRPSLPTLAQVADRHLELYLEALAAPFSPLGDTLG